MVIRSYQESDLEQVLAIHKRSSDFPMPAIDQPLYVVKEVAVIEDKVIGLGLIRISSEVITILDLDQPRSVRARAVQKLLETGIFKSQKLGIDEMHAFLTGEITHSFADVLKRKFGFVDCEGIPLTLKL